ncbi:LysR family transcriptional regulator [Kocuria sp. cx-455]|uniref:LysR family transcriptional regulator n=1 Tax=Kocuria sp. cx-455 TaxID=2771377 RepID=UPI003D702BA5
MTDFTLRQLEYFVAAVETASITAAAERCYASQGAASMAIGQLEKATGAPLLVRGGSRAVVPTPAGQEFLVHARDILDRAEEARDAVSESLDALRGTLRVGVSTTLSPRLVPILAAHFTTEHPQVDLQLIERAPHELQEQVLGGRVSLAFLYGLQAEEGLTITEVAPVQLHLILPAGHRLAGEHSVWLRDVVEEPAILLDVPPTADRMTAIAESVGLTLDVRWRSANMDTIRSLVAAGLGFSFANSIPATGAAYSGGSVVYRPVADDIPRNYIVAATLPGRVPRRVQTAIDLVTATESPPPLPAPTSVPR